MNKFLSVLLIGTITNVFANSSQINSKLKYKVYVLEPGDTLSELLYEEGYKPLYGTGNWVDKILKANHLSENSVRRIKKGLPIILPTDKNIDNAYKTKIITKYIQRDSVKTTQAATMQTGLLANSISKHQNYGINFQYFYRDMETKKERIYSGENFALSLTYNDKKDNNIMNNIIKPHLEAGIQAHGSNYVDGNTSLNFRPTYFAQSTFYFNNQNNIQLGPKVKGEITSRVTRNTEDYTVRRDTSIWAGLEAKATYEKNLNTFVFKGELLSTIASSENANFKDVNGQRIGLDMETNLLNNYYIGLFSFREQYPSMILDNITATGINLRYILE